MKLNLARLVSGSALALVAYFMVPGASAQPGPDHEKNDSRDQHAGGQRGAADMVSLYVVGKRQLHAGSSLGDRSSIATVRPKKGKCSSILDANAAIAPKGLFGLKSRAIGVWELYGREGGWFGLGRSRTGL